MAGQQQPSPSQSVALSPKGLNLAGVLTSSPTVRNTMPSNNTNRRTVPRGKEIKFPSNFK